jgi:CBS-domain-containing membrane protein
MKAGDVMTSAVISATGDTSVRDIAQLLLQNHISAIPILDNSGAPVGVVSEGDLIGRDETQRNARHEWWLALLAEGESLSPDFLSRLRSPGRVASDIMSRRSSPSAKTPIPARSRVCLLHIESSACPW